MHRLKFAPEERFDLSFDKMAEMPGFDDEDSLIVVLTYRCNSRCRFCIVEPEISDRLPDTARETVQKVLDHNAGDGRFKRLTLSGAEVTLRADLAEIAESATSHGRFEVVRIQTNARRLRDADYCDELIAAPIREYFVSIHAHTPALDAHITKAPDSYSEMVAGVGNLLARGARVISNTVICRSNHEALPDIARFILDLGVRELHFWSFLELEGVAQSDELVALGDSLPPLTAALDVVERAGASATVKWMPRCLLGDHAARLDNHQPHMFIHDQFQARLNQSFEFRCVHADACRHYRRGCDGLHQRYIEVFGDEAARLRPEPQKD
jgi:pyruvate-formate lyase-activating enzyme